MAKPINIKVTKEATRHLKNAIRAIKKMQKLHNEVNESLSFYRVKMELTVKTEKI